MVQLPSADNSIKRGTPQRASNVQSIQNNDLSAVGQAVREVSEASARNVANASATMGRLGEKLFIQQQENQYYGAQIDASVAISEGVNSYLDKEYDPKQQSKETWAQEYERDITKVSDKFAEAISNPSLRNKLKANLRLQAADAKNKVTQLWVKKARVAESVLLGQRVEELVPVLSSSSTPLQEAITSTAFEDYGENLIKQGIIDKAEFEKYRKDLASRVVEMRLLNTKNPKDLLAILDNEDNAVALQSVDQGQLKRMRTHAEESARKQDIWLGANALMEEFPNDPVGASEAIQKRYANDPRGYEYATDLETIVSRRYQAQQEQETLRLAEFAKSVQVVAQEARDRGEDVPAAVNAYVGDPENAENWQKIGFNDQIALENFAQFALRPNAELYTNVSSKLMIPSLRKEGVYELQNLISKGLLTREQAEQLTEMARAPFSELGNYEPTIKPQEMLAQFKTQMVGQDKKGKTDYEGLAQYYQVVDDYDNCNKQQYGLLGRDPSTGERLDYLRELRDKYITPHAIEGDKAEYEPPETVPFTGVTAAVDSLRGEMEGRAERLMAESGRALDDRTRESIRRWTDQAVEQSGLRRPLEATASGQRGSVRGRIGNSAQEKRRRLLEKMNPNPEQRSEQLRDVRRFVQLQIDRTFRHDLPVSAMIEANKHVHFVKRILDPRLNVTDERLFNTGSGQMETHRLTHQTQPDPELGAFLVYPMIHQISGDYRRFPENDEGFRDSLNYAKRKNNYIAFSTEEAALNFVQTYKGEAFMAHMNDVERERELGL